MDVAAHLLLSAGVLGRKSFTVKNEIHVRKFISQSARTLTQFFIDGGEGALNERRNDA